jgi:hypothetical protein
MTIFVARSLFATQARLGKTIASPIEMEVCQKRRICFISDRRAFVNSLRAPNPNSVNYYLTQENATRVCKPGGDVIACDGAVNHRERPLYSHAATLSLKIPTPVLPAIVLPVIATAPITNIPAPMTPPRRRYYRIPCYRSRSMYPVGKISPRRPKVHYRPQQPDCVKLCSR